MSDNKEVRASGNRMHGVGVINLGIPKSMYIPYLHNPSRPLRPGSQDAFKCPSLGACGQLTPYWGNK